MDRPPDPSAVPTAPLSPPSSPLLTRPLTWGLVALATLLSATGTLQQWMWPFVTDDAYITFRYVERLVGGDGLTFNPGERVEGFSNPLWLFLLAGWKVLTGGSVVTGAQVMGGLLQLGVFGLLGLLCRSFPPGTRLASFSFSLFLLLITPGVQVYATLGMEVPLLMFLLMAGVALSVRAFPSRPALLVLAGLCFGLAGITRPEGLLYGALWGIGVVALWKRRARRWWILERFHFGWNRSSPSYLRKCVVLDGICDSIQSGFALAGVLTLAPAVLYEVFRLHYFGSWIPNTAVAKVRGFFGDSPFLTDWVIWLPTLLGLLAVILTLRPARTPTKNPSPLFLLAGGPIAAGVIFCLYAGTDWMLFGRFFLPVWPLVIVCLVAAFEIRRQANDLSPWRAFGVRAGVVGLSLAGWLSVSLPFLANQGLAAMLMRGTDQVAVGTWLAHAFPQPLVVATNRLGAVSYRAPHHTFRDLLGLTDLRQAHVLRADPVHAIERVGLSEANPLLWPTPPDIVLVTRPPQSTPDPAYTEAELSFMRRTYVLLKRFPQGQWGTFDVWARKGLTPAP